MAASAGLGLSSMKDVLDESVHSFNAPTFGLVVLLFVGIILGFVISRRKISSSSFGAKDLETVIVGGTGSYLEEDVEENKLQPSFRFRVNAIEVTQAPVQTIKRPHESLSCACIVSKTLPSPPSIPLMDSPSRRLIDNPDVFSMEFVSVEPLQARQVWSGDQELVQRFLRDSVECSALSPPALDNWVKQDSNEDLSLRRPESTSLLSSF
mmetsp:Transcript_35291/g.57081  ORF Transcript_35291/g.57081 Transcript_35291/m.57081 type:complete len:209 (+) Transcript_35291:224-850(+)